MSQVHWLSYKIDTVNSEGIIPHTHTRTSEIIQTFENEGNVLINGQLHKMQRNGLYFIHGLATHFVSPGDMNRYNHTILVLNTSELEKMCRNLKIKDVYNKLFVENGGTFCELPPKQVIEVDSILCQMNETFPQNDQFKYAKFSSMLTSLFEIGLKNATRTLSRSNKFSDILSFISDNALSKLTIDDICNETHISKYHLCRLFKENVGVTIGSFIKTRRLAIAKQLLITTRMPITEIAYKCCFTDSSFFTKTFTKEFGITPSEFRKANK